MNNLADKSDKYYACTRQEMLRFVEGLPSPRKILEIGCGEGSFSHNFSNVEYWGVEPAGAPAERAAKSMYKVLIGCYDDVSPKIPEGYFDLVVCNDVIEHMIDPIGFLNNIKDKLCPTGKLIASLPNIRHIEILYKLILRGEFDYEKAGILDYTHLHFFTPKSFSKMAASCGWRIEKLEPAICADFRPLKKLVLRIIEFLFKTRDFRTAQFGVRMSPMRD